MREMQVRKKHKKDGSRILAILEVITLIDTMRITSFFLGFHFLRLLHAAELHVGADKLYPTVSFIFT